VVSSRGGYMAGALIKYCLIFNHLALFFTLARVKEILRRYNVNVIILKGISKQKINIFILIRPLTNQGELQGEHYFKLFQNFSKTK